MQQINVWNKINLFLKNRKQFYAINKVIDKVDIK